MGIPIYVYFIVVWCGYVVVVEPKSDQEKDELSNVSDYSPKSICISDVFVSHTVKYRYRDL